MSDLYKRSKIINWLCNTGLYQGILWGCLIYITSATNDVLMGLLGQRLPAIEIAFFRFLFSLLVISVPVFINRRKYLKTSIHSLHLLRGILGAIALGLCCYSVKVMPLAENTTILFSESLFVLPLSYIFLREKVSLKVVIANIIGFCGLLLMYHPRASNFNIMALIPTIAAALFASMDILIKKMINNNEHTITMLFFFALYTTMLSGVFVPSVWTTPTMHELILILLLGIGANIIQLFIFLAYRATTASNLSVVRYIELPIAILFGYLFFGQIPQTYALISATLIIIGTYIMAI